MVGAFSVLTWGGTYSGLRAGYLSIGGFGHADFAYQLVSASPQASAKFIVMSFACLSAPVSG